MTEPPSPPLPYVGYVGFVTRVVALIVDAVCIDLAALLIGGAIKLLLSLVGASSHVSLGVILAGGFVWAFIWSGAYFAFFWSFTGQTPGARLLGFRVVRRETYARLGFARAARRVLGFYLAALPLGIGFLPVLLDDERRGWHDRFAGTVVRWAPPDWALAAAARKRERRSPAPDQSAPAASSTVA